MIEQPIVKEEEKEDKENLSEGSESIDSEEDSDEIEMKKNQKMIQYRLFDEEEVLEIEEA